MKYLRSDRRFLSHAVIAAGGRAGPGLKGLLRGLMTAGFVGFAGFAGLVSVAHAADTVVIPKGQPWDRVLRQAAAASPLKMEAYLSLVRALNPDSFRTPQDLPKPGATLLLPDRALQGLWVAREGGADAAVRAVAEARASSQAAAEATDTARPNSTQGTEAGALRPRWVRFP